MVSEKRRAYEKEYRRTHQDYYREYWKKHKPILQERSKSKRIKKLKERYENAFYYKVYEECIKKGVTHESLCKSCNIVSNTLRMYLLLEWNIDAKDLVHIAEALNMDPCELFESYILALKEKDADNERNCNDSQ